MATPTAWHAAPRSKATATSQFECADVVSLQKTCAPPSRQQSLHHEGRNRTGQLLIEPLKLVDESVVVNSQTVKNRSVEVAYVHRILHDVVAVVVSFTIRNPRADTATCHPCGETSRMMITSIVVLRQATLAIHSAPELSRP